MKDEQAMTNAAAGLPKCLDATILTYGEPMVKMMLDTEVAQEAAMRLHQELQRIRNPEEGLRALGILAQAFNNQVNARAEKEGWQADMMQKCSQDIQLAFALQIQVPQSKIIVPH